MTIAASDILSCPELIPATPDFKPVIGVSFTRTPVESEAIVNHPMPIEFSTLSEDHQRLALFQTKAQFWAYFAGAWGMLALGLIPLAFLLLMPPQPLTLKLMAIGLSISFETFSLCFARSLKQTRRWLDDYYDRLQRDKRILQAWQLVDTIEDVKLRDKMKAKLAQCLFRDEPQIGHLENTLRRLFQRTLLPGVGRTKS